MSGLTSVAERDTTHLAYLDCVRGYAILMVIACHAVDDFPELPYPAKRFFVLGWFGVQLFFMASAVTLLMSWKSQQRHGGNDLRAFAVRRVFRIVPAYYCAAILYHALIPHPYANIWSFLPGALFMNTWHPAFLIGDDAWILVPGGWSISVEMTFYLVFPLFAAFVTSLSRAVIMVVTTLVAGTAMNLLLIANMGQEYSTPALSNYLFFWFPNQVSIFAFGGVVYYLIPRLSASAWFRRIGPAVATASILAFCTLGLFPSGHFLGDAGIPGGHVAALILAVFLLALSANGSLFVNRPIAALGRVSFSAYLLHFAVLKLIPAFPVVFQPHATGVKAIVAYGFGLAFVTLATFLVASLSVRFIEAPMIGAGRRLIGMLPQRPKRALLSAGS